MTTAVATKFNKHQIYGILKDYHWKLREIQRLDRDLLKTDFRGAAQYGIEATLPHAVGIVGKALENEVIRRNKKSSDLLKYCEQINFINENMHKVTDEKEKVVLDCLLEGMDITAISHHLRTNRRHVHLLRDNIVNHLSL